MKVKITANYEPDPDEVDDEDATGLTMEAFDELNNQLMAAGLDNIEIVKEAT